MRGGGEGRKGVTRWGRQERQMSVMTSRETQDENKLGVRKQEECEKKEEVMCWELQGI